MLFLVYEWWNEGLFIIIFCNICSSNLIQCHQLNLALFQYIQLIHDVYHGRWWVYNRLVIFSISLHEDVTNILNLCMMIITAKEITKEKAFFQYLIIKLYSIEPNTILSYRLEICQRFTWPNFRAKQFYTLKTRKLRLFLPAIKQCKCIINISNLVFFFG